MGAIPHKAVQVKETFVCAWIAGTSESFLYECFRAQDTSEQEKSDSNNFQTHILALRVSPTHRPPLRPEKWQRRSRMLS